MILRRLTAFLYDCILLLALFVIWTALLVLVNKGQALPPNLWYRLSLLLIIACYSIGFWRYGGQTSGMKAWGLKIVDAQNTDQRLRYSQAILRFVTLLPSIILPLNIFDRMSHTRMIYQPLKP